MLSNYTIRRHVKLPPSRIVTSQNILPNVNHEIFRLTTSPSLDNSHTPIVIFLFLSFRRVLNVIYSFLGNSPASEYEVYFIHLPMKMEPIVSS